MIKIMILIECACNAEGSKNLNCDANTGQCHCKCAIDGIKCDTCTDMHYKFPDCESNCKITKYVLITDNTFF